MSTNALHPQKVGTSEHLFPFLLAAMEACLACIVCVELANINFLGSNDLLFPLWLPFLLLTGACWFVRYPGHHVLRAFPALKQDIEMRYPRPLFALWLMLGLIEILFLICSTTYTPFVFDVSWFTSTTHLALTATSVIQIIIVLVVAVFLCWRGVQIARSSIDTAAIGHVLRIALLGCVFIVVQRVVQELLYSGEVPHDDVTLFFLVAFLCCLSLLAYPLAQRTYLFRFHLTGMRESFKKQEYLFLTAIALFYLLALAGVWYIIAHYNHWLVLASKIEPKPLSSGDRAYFPFPKFRSVVNGSAKLFAGISPTSKIVFFVVLGLILSIVVIRAIQRWLKQLSKDDDIHESTWSWSLFWSQLKAFISTLFSRFLPITKDEKKGEFRQQESMSSETAVHTVRQLYRALLQQAKHAGYPRRRHETPTEFRYRLSETFPSAEAHLQTITNAYIVTRYGQYIPDDIELAKIQEAWAELEMQWRENMSSNLI